MKVIIAIDSFKGCLTSKEANGAAAAGVRSAYPDAEVVEVPVSDGGEGYMDAFRAAIWGRQEEVTVRDPLMRSIVAKYESTPKSPHCRNGCAATPSPQGEGQGWGL